MSEKQKYFVTLFYPGEGPEMYRGCTGLKVNGESGLIEFVTADGRRMCTSVPFVTREEGP